MEQVKICLVPQFDVIAVEKVKEMVLTQEPIFHSAVHSGVLSLPHLSLENKSITVLQRQSKRLTKHWSTYVFFQTEAVYKMQIPRLCCFTILGSLRVPKEIGQDMIWHFIKWQDDISPSVRDLRIFLKGRGALHGSIAVKGLALVWNLNFQRTFFNNAIHR